MSDPSAAGDETEKSLPELLVELPDRLRDEADAAVADARDADDLVERLAGLRERHDAGSEADETTPGASSDADRRAKPDAADGSDGTDAESTASDDDGVFGRVRSTLDGVRDRATGDDTDSEIDADARSRSMPVPSRDVSLPSADASRSRDVVRAARERAGAGAIELRRTLSEADPKQAALWGLATGVTVANPAIAASYSTAALLSGAVLGGGAVGAYTSSHDDTVFDDIDPMVMARRANAGASTGAGARNLDGKSAGTMLGASAYLAEQLTPEAYAQWIAEADAESVLQGAEMGADRASASDDFEGARSGAVLGGGLGLLYGLAADDHGDGDADSLRTLLDDDLWDEYAGRLGNDERADTERENRLDDENGTAESDDDRDA